MSPRRRSPARAARAILGAPERERGVADDQHDAESRRELQQLGRAHRCASAAATSISAPSERDGERRQQHRRPRSRARPRRSADQRVRDVRAQHVQRAVREVDDAGDAEDQRQTGGDEEQRRRAGKAVAGAGSEARRRGGHRASAMLRAIARCEPLLAASRTASVAPDAAA